MDVKHFVLNNVIKYWSFVIIYSPLQLSRELVLLWNYVIFKLWLSFIDGGIRILYHFFCWANVGEGQIFLGSDEDDKFTKRKISNGAWCCSVFSWRCILPMRRQSEKEFQRRNNENGKVLQLFSSVPSNNYNFEYQYYSRQNGSSKKKNHIIIKIIKGESPERKLSSKNIRNMSVK